MQHVTATRMSFRARLVLTGAAVAALFLFGGSFAPDAAARMRCSYSGAPQNLLTVRADGTDGEIARRGRRIVVREFLEPSRTCQGGVPTVLNTDTIRVLSLRSSTVDVLLRGGPFAPGATRERTGAPEIEIRMQFRGRANEGFAELRGTRRADEFHWGRGPTTHAGLNLNPRAAGDRDVDVTVRGRDAFLVADGGVGNDTIVPAPGAQSPGVYSTGGPGNDLLIAPRNSWGILEGGRGDDVLLGGRQGDLVYGGGGRDRLISDGGDDEVRAGPGRDLIASGPGKDLIDSRDFKSFPRTPDPDRDWVACGTNQDRVRADRRDRLHACEVIRRR